MTIEEFYDVMDITKIVFLEDDITYDYSLTSYLYSIFCMNSDERCVFYNALKETNNGELANNTEKVVQYFENLEEFDVKDIHERQFVKYAEKILKSDNLEILKIIDAKQLDNAKLVFENFGVCIRSNSVYFPAMVKKNSVDGRLFPVRIFKTYDAEDKDRLCREINDSCREKKNFVCVIDDNINGESCSEKIIDDICQECKEISGRGVFIIISSKAEKARVDDQIYVDFVLKEDTDEERKNEKICDALTRSAYASLLKRMEMQRLEAVEKAYTYATQNKNNMYYLVSMAQDEGITNFEVIREWLEAKENFYWASANSIEERDDKIEERKKLIALSAFVNRAFFDKEKVELSEWDNINEQQTFEYFDYDINKYFSVIKPGDIFKIRRDEKSEFFLLIGQECDMSLRKNKGAYRRKKQECYLVPIRFCEKSYLPKNMINYNSPNILLTNFKDEENYGSIVIDITKSSIIDDEILDLCSYNADGKAAIDVEKKLSKKIRQLVTIPMQERYSDLQNNLKKYSLAKKKLDEMAISLDDLQIGRLDREYSKYEISLIDSKAEYPIERVCRLKMHIDIINKMFSEYQWRSGFDTIMLDALEATVFTVCINGKEHPGINGSVISTNNRNNNRNREKLTWYIKKADISSIFADENMDEIDEFLTQRDEWYIFDKKSANNKVYEYKKVFDSETANHRIEIGKK